MTENNTTEAATIGDTMAAVYDKLHAADATSAATPAAVDSVDAVTDDLSDAGSAPDGEALDATPVSDPTAPSASLQAPTSWTTEAKAEWSKLPPKIQEHILKREKDVAKGFEEKGREANFGKSIRQTLAPHRNDYEASGMNEEQAVKYLTDLHATYKRDPVSYGAMIVQAQENPAQFLNAIAQSMGLTISASPQQQGQQDYNNPQLMALQRKLSALEQNITTREHSELQAQIDTFKTDKEHFEEVKPLMAALLQGGQAQDLQSAYDMAIHASPNVRQRIFDDQRKAEEEKRQKDAQSKAAAAKKSANINVKSSKGSSPIGSKSMYDTMQAVADRMMAT